MILIYIDIILLIILIALTLFSLCFCVFHMRRLYQKGKVTILVNQKKVLYAQYQDDQDEQFKSVACHSPGWGPYEELQRGTAPTAPPSPDSGLSEAYEPLRLPDEQAAPSPGQYNGVSRTRHWNYTEYQI